MLAHRLIVLCHYHLLWPYLLSFRNNISLNVRYAVTRTPHESQPLSLGTPRSCFPSFFHIKTTGGIKGECVWSQVLELHSLWCHSGKTMLGKFDYQLYISWHLYCVQDIHRLHCTKWRLTCTEAAPSFALKKKEKPHFLSPFSMATADTAYQRCTWAAA